MAIYKAKEKCFVDGVFRKSGQIFSTDMKFKKCPGYLEEIKLSAADKKKLTTKAKAIKDKAAKDQKEINQVTNNSSNNFMGDTSGEVETL